MQLSIGRNNKDDGLANINLKPNNSNLRTQTCDVVFCVRYVLRQQQTFGQTDRYKLCEGVCVCVCVYGVFTVIDERVREGEKVKP